MTDVGVGVGGQSTSRVLELDALLLDAKLSAPRPRPGTVSRAGLIESARSSGYQVVGVTAPAGYGKSTLLAEWAHDEDRPVAWVSLDEFDDDPRSCSRCSPPPTRGSRLTTRTWWPT